MLCVPLLECFAHHGVNGLSFIASLGNTAMQDHGFCLYLMALTVAEVLNVEFVKQANDMVADASQPRLACLAHLSLRAAQPHICCRASWGSAQKAASSPKDG